MKISVLTGKPDTRQRQAPAAQGAQEPAKHHEVMTAAMDALGAQLAQARTDLEASRGETTAERTKAADLQVRLTAEAERRATAEGALAAEQAVSAGLRAQLETERRATEQLKGPLTQAIAAAAKDPVMVHPQKAEPPSYEVVVLDRDAGNHMRRMTIKPITQKRAPE